MSIDTAAKRRSAAGTPFLSSGPSVTPDATQPAFWRASVGWTYSFAGGPPPTTHKVHIASPQGTPGKLKAF